MDPYKLFNIAPESDDDAIRRRYLQLVKEFPPERDPLKFSEIRQAYDELKDLNTRLRNRVFHPGKNETVEAIIEDYACRTTRRRFSLKELFGQHRKA